MPLNSFAPALIRNVVCTNTAQTVSTSGSNAVITNYGNAPAFVTVNATTSFATGMIVLPNQSIVLAVDSNNISVIGAGAILNVASGD